jgi:lysozyme
MKLSDSGFKFLARLEGENIGESGRHLIYKDSAGLWTAGIGHLLTKDELSSGKVWIQGEGVKYADGLTTSQTRKLFAQDAECFETSVLKSITRLTIFQHQFDSFVSLAFNIGQEAFKRSTLLRMFNEGQEADVVLQFRRWKYSGGKVDKGLVNRREKEIKLFLTGEYENQSV